MYAQQYSEAPGALLRETRDLEHRVLDLAAELLRQGLELRRLARQLDRDEHRYTLPTVRETSWTP